EAHAIIGSLQYEPSDSVVGFNLLFTLAAGWDSGEEGIWRTPRAVAGDTQGPLDVRGDALRELLHELDLRIPLEQRQVAPRHELDWDRHPVPHLEQDFDELVRGASVRGPARQQGFVRALERGRAGRRKRPDRRRLHVAVLPVQRPD